MSILVDTIRVAGFRGLNNVEVSLPKIAVLIGANNSGKTSLLKAFSLALGDYFRFVSEEDFYIGPDEKRAEEILVDVRIIPFDGKTRTKNFNEEWATEFGDSIRSEANGNQYLPMRSRCEVNAVKGGFETQRLFLEKWPDFAAWNTESIKEKKFSRLESILFLSIEAQRDIHQELKAKSSYVGKVLSDIVYDKGVIEKLEEQIKLVNQEAVEKSTTLKSLKKHLENLNRSFDGSGQAEITPFPKKVRDLSKNFSVHVGETGGGTFPMEYHGMGTRSWASMLTVMAFSDLIAEKHEKDVKPFFSIVAAEEPEAHLHPSAQKTLYRQLAETKGQVIVSTHSPYLAALAKSQDLRFLRRSEGKVNSFTVNITPGSEEQRKLEREILNTRGEILFSKAIILCEGETEEQALPRIFEKIFGKEAFELGISFVGVGGSGGKYAPFLRLCKDFELPFFIFSDGEDSAIQGLKKIYEEVFSSKKIEDCKSILFLKKGTNFEEYLVEEGFTDQFLEAIKSIDGGTALADWIKRTEGQVKERKQLGKDACEKCKRPVVEDVLWDFSGTEGQKRALLKYVSSYKTKIAPAMADQLCKLSNDKLPKKISEFFKIVKEGVGVT